MKPVFPTSYFFLLSLLTPLSIDAQTPAPTPQSTTVTQTTSKTSTTAAKPLSSPITSTSHASANQMAPIVVKGEPVENLDTPSSTTSRLDLSPRETPQAVDVITEQEIKERGYEDVEQAIDSLPGVTSGGTPADPSQFSVRGLQGNQITLLHDGIYVGPSNMVNRPENSYNLAGIDFLKGPASVLYGQGAIGGAINMISKVPSYVPWTADGTVAYGRFNTWDWGLGGGATIIPNTLAMRADISRNSSNGWITRDNSNSLEGTISFLYNPIPELTIMPSFDYSQDDLPDSYGTPLVPKGDAKNSITGVVSGYIPANPNVGASAAGAPATIDASTRYLNYNVNDAVDSSQQMTPKINVSWQATPDFTISDTAYAYIATRDFVNAENYTYISPTELDRDRFFVFHQQKIYGNQLTGTYESKLFGMDNRVSIGADYYHLDFIRTRGFPDGDSVDPYAPQAGSFGSEGGQLKSPTTIDQLEGFGEDILSVTQQFKVVTGIRDGFLDLNRENFGATGEEITTGGGAGFERTYHPLGYRVGLLYDVTPTITPYISYSTAQDPGGNNIFLVNAGQNAGLTNSDQVEFGVKASNSQNTVSGTAAFYDIHRQNIIVATSDDTVSTGGTQRSLGIELSSEWKVTKNWSFDFNGAYTDAHYGHFLDTSTGLDDSGKIPADVPAWTANAWSNFKNIGGIPLDMGVGVRYVGNRYADNSDQLVMLGYETVDLYATYHINKNLDLSVRGFNVLDTVYAQWADINYPSQIQLGEPASWQVSLTAKF